MRAIIRSMMTLTSGATIGIGSLPFTDPSAAVEHAFTQYDIPFLPQLPQAAASETMIAGSFWGMKDLICETDSVRFKNDPTAELLERIDSPHLNPGMAWEIFLDRARTHNGPVKIQHAGPFVLACFAFYPDGKELIASPRGLQLCLALVRSRIKFMIDQLKSAGVREVIVFLDEPVLFIDREPHPLMSEVLDSCIRLIHDHDCLAGLHSCGSAPWSSLLSSGLDILSLDATAGLEEFLTHREALEAHLGRGGFIAWGIVSTTGKQDEDPQSILKKISEEIPSLVLGHALLTPSCGTGLLTPERERAILDDLKTAQKLLRSSLTP